MDWCTLFKKDAMHKKFYMYEASEKDSVARFLNVSFLYQITSPGPIRGTVPWDDFDFC